MTAQISRFNVQTVAKPSDSVTLAALSASVIALATGKWPGALPPSDLRISRSNVQTIGVPKSAQTLAAMTVSALALATAKWPPPSAISSLLLTRFNVQTIAQPKVGGTLASLGVAVLADATAKWPPASFISNLQISRFNVQTVALPRVSGTLASMGLSVLGKGVLPPDPIPIPAILDVLRHNWISQTRLTTTWATDVIQSALNLSEERRGLVPRPYRMIEFQWTGAQQGGSHRALMTLARMANERFVMPLYTDVSHTSADSTGTTLNVPTAFRRFQTGGFLVVFQQGDDCEPLGIQVREIEVVGSDTIIVTSGLSGTVPLGSYVMPLIYTEIVRASQFELESDHFGKISFAVEEVVGPTALIALASGTGGASLFEGDPVFPFRPHWGSSQGVGVKRQGSTESVGRGVSVFLRGQRPQFNFKLGFRSLGRAEAFQIASFFDTRRGRLLPFWVANPLATFEIVNWSLAQADVVPRGRFENLQAFVSAFAVLLDNGQVILRRASAVLDLGATWRIGFDVPLPVEATNLSDVTRFTTAHHVRFSQDFLSEVWQTNEAADVSLTCEEILVEEDIVLVVDIEEPSLELPVTETPRRQDLDGKLWLSARTSDVSFITKDGANRVSDWADKYLLHSGVSQANPALQPLYDAAAFGGLGGVRFAGSLGEFLEGISPLPGEPFFAMGVMELSNVTDPATLFVAYNAGAPTNLFRQKFTGSNAIPVPTSDPAMISETSDPIAGILGGDTITLTPDFPTTGGPAYAVGVPFGTSYFSFTDATPPNPASRNVLGRVRNPTTQANDTLVGGGILKPLTSFPAPSGVDTLRIGADLSGTPNCDITIGELIFFNYNPGVAQVIVADFLTNLMFDYYAARWPIQ